MMAENTEYFNVTDDGKTTKISLKPDAKDALGDVKFVDIVPSDTQLEQDDMFASVEAKKAVVELETPFKGKVVEVNESLEENPEKIFDQDSWIVKLEKM